MCYITAHDRQKPTHVDDSISVIGIKIPKNEKTEALK